LAAALSVVIIADVTHHLYACISDLNFKFAAIVAAKNAVGCCDGKY